jgi:hypothetical protein
VRLGRASPSPPAPPPAQPRHILLRLLLILAVAAFLASFLPSPWAFHIGGRFTPLMQWDGYGPVRASGGGHYLLFTQLQGGIISNHADPRCSLRGCGTLRGSAKLCTVSGRVYTFSLGGAMHGWLTTDRSRTDIRLSGGSPVPLPRGRVVAFHGTWHGPALPIADTGHSFAGAFTAAGTISKTAATPAAGTAHGTLRHGSMEAFDQACHALAASAR